MVAARIGMGLDGTFHASTVRIPHFQLKLSALRRVFLPKGGNLWLVPEAGRICRMKSAGLGPVRETPLAIRASKMQAIFCTVSSVFWRDYSIS